MLGSHDYARAKGAAGMKGGDCLPSLPIVSQPRSIVRPVSPSVTFGSFSLAISLSRIAPPFDYICHRVATRRRRPPPPPPPPVDSLSVESFNLF